MSLFQTSAWQTAWWQAFGETSGFELSSPLAQPGCSALYIHRYTFAALLPIRCLQFVGASYRRLSTPRTEYNTLGPADTYAEAFGRIEEKYWSEAVFSDVKANSDETAFFQRRAKEAGWYVRNLRLDTAYFVDVRGVFRSYLSSLGSNTRLKLFNRRKVVEAMGEIDETNYWPERLEEFFDLLNSFHRVRWGSDCFNQKSIEFHINFLNKASVEGASPYLMVMSLAGKPVSLLYNIRYERSIYNLQAGYEERLHKKVSLGTLHLGYAIESAFNDPTVDLFDFLAGSGKNTNYKERLATGQEELLTYMIVRSRFFICLYKLKDFLAAIRKGKSGNMSVSGTENENGR